MAGSEILRSPVEGTVGFFPLSLRVSAPSHVDVWDFFPSTVSLGSVTIQRLATDCFPGGSGDETFNIAIKHHGCRISFQVTHPPW